MVSMVPEVYQKYDWTEEDGTNMAGWQDLMKAAGTVRIGKDGRLLELRRQRRSRLRAQARRVEMGHWKTSRVEQRRFETLDEEHVAEKLLQLQREALSSGTPLQW